MLDEDDAHKNDEDDGWWVWCLIRMMGDENDGDDGGQTDRQTDRQTNKQTNEQYNY